MRRKTDILTLVLVALLCCAFMPAVSAFTVDPLTTATSLSTGDAVTMRISGLTDGDTFKYRLTSTDIQLYNVPVTLSRVDLPFSYKTSPLPETKLVITSGITPGSQSLTYTYNGGSQFTIPADSATSDTITTHKNIKSGYYYLSMTGTRTGGAVGVDYYVTGTVEGNHASVDLTFTLQEVKSGTFTIEISDASGVVRTKTYTVSQPAPPPNPSGGSEGYGGEAPAGPAAPAAPAAPAQLAPMQGTTTTTATITHNQEGQVLATYTIETDPAAGFESQVEIQSGTKAVMGPGTPNPGQPVGEITVTPLDPATVTIDTATSGTFSFSGLAIECGPEGAQFSGSPVTVSFTMTAAQWADALAAVNGNIAAMTIQTYDPATKSWVEIPTVVDPVTHTVSAQVTHFSTYAVFYKSEAAASVKTIGELAQVTPFQPRVTTAATTPAPTQMAPVATPTRQGGIFDGIVNWFNSLFGKK